MPRRPSPARGDQIQQLTAKIMLGHQHLPAVIQADVINGSAGEPAGTAAGRSGYGRPDPPTAGHRCNGRCPHAALHGAVLLDPGRHDPHQPIVRLTSAAHHGQSPGRGQWGAGPESNGQPARAATTASRRLILTSLTATIGPLDARGQNRDSHTARTLPRLRRTVNGRSHQLQADSTQTAARAACGQPCGQPVDTPPATASPPNASPECGAR